MVDNGYWIETDLEVWIGGEDCGEEPVDGLGLLPGDRHFDGEVVEVVVGS